MTKEQGLSAFKKYVNIYLKDNYMVKDWGFYISNLDEIVLVVYYINDYCSIDYYDLELMVYFDRLKSIFDFDFKRHISDIKNNNMMYTYRKIDKEDI